MRRARSSTCAGNRRRDGCSISSTTISSARRSACTRSSCAASSLSRRRAQALRRGLSSPAGSSSATRSISSPRRSARAMRWTRRCRALCAQQVPGDTFRNLEVRADYSAQTFKHILAPVWLLSYTYGARAFQCVMNGVTGAIRGEYPKSPWKVALLVLVVIIVVVASCSRWEAGTERELRRAARRRASGVRAVRTMARNGCRESALPVMRDAERIGARGLAWLSRMAGRCASSRPPPRRESALDYESADRASARRSLTAAAACTTSAMRSRGSRSRAPRPRSTRPCRRMRACGGRASRFARDAATLLDESGDARRVRRSRSCCGQWRAHDWRAAFGDRREADALRLRACSSSGTDCSPNASHRIARSRPRRSCSRLPRTIFRTSPELGGSTRRGRRGTYRRAGARLVARIAAAAADRRAAGLGHRSDLGARLFDDASVFRPRAAAIERAGGLVLR